MGEIRERMIAGAIYYTAVAEDGWPTGPCTTREKALERVAAYERGEPVSLAAPGQASHAQMSAWLGHLLACAHEDASLADLLRFVATAAEDGLHSEAWVRASSLMRRHARDPGMYTVIQAGGAMVTRRLAETPIPVRGDSL